MMAKPTESWSAKVNEESDTLDLLFGVFVQADPTDIVKEVTGVTSSRFAPRRRY